MVQVIITKSFILVLAKLKWLILMSPLQICLNFNDYFFDGKDW